jgi:hypothetical protein
VHTGGAGGAAPGWARAAPAAAKSAHTVVNRLIVVVSPGGSSVSLARAGRHGSPWIMPASTPKSAWPHAGSRDPEPLELGEAL